LRAAEGWLELGDAMSASDELEEISPTEKKHPAVLSMRCAIYLQAQKWNLAAEVALKLTEVLPEDAGGWIHYAYATRRKTSGGIPQAKAILLVAEPEFPKHYLFPFNLACYCSQLNELEEAERWLRKAMAIDEVTVMKMALSDPDLKPLMDSLGGKFKK
jgi:tetratricopeptide (TPR) repeat protein